MAATAAPPAPTGRRLSVGPSVGLLPFLVYVTIFLLIPTITVVVGAVLSIWNVSGAPAVSTLPAPSLLQNFTVCSPSDPTEKAPL